MGCELSHSANDGGHKCRATQFLSDEGDDVNKAAAEAAVALLIDLVDLKDHSRYVRFDGGYIASQLGIWSKAIAAIKLLLSNEKRLSEWSNPGKKAEVLKQLLADLEIATKRIADIERRA